MFRARERTLVLCVESDESARDRVLVHGPNRCSASMTILAFLETCAIGPNTVVLTDRLDQADLRTTQSTCPLGPPGSARSRGSTGGRRRTAGGGNGRTPAPGTGQERTLHT
jgi:hypothetical protein